MEEIIVRLKKAGIEPVGIYSDMPEIVADAIEMVREFGYDNWARQTCLGIQIKRIIKDLA